MSSRPELKIDWATYEAAKYAVEHWHSRNAAAGQHRPSRSKKMTDAFPGIEIKKVK